MSVKFPIYLNLEFFKNTKQISHVQDTLLCHVEHNDYGKKTRAIPLKINSSGHITLDFAAAVAIDVVG